MLQAQVKSLGYKNDIGELKGTVTRKAASALSTHAGILTPRQSLWTNLEINKIFNQLISMSKYLDIRWSSTYSFYSHFQIIKKYIATDKDLVSRDWQNAIITPAVPIYILIAPSAHGKSKAEIGGRMLSCLILMVLIVYFLSRVKRSCQIGLVE